jgi:hypothetical protein
MYAVEKMKKGPNIFYGGKTWRESGKEGESTTTLHRTR